MPIPLSEWLKRKQAEQGQYPSNTPVWRQGTPEDFVRSVEGTPSASMQPMRYPNLTRPWYIEEPPPEEKTGGLQEFGKEMVGWTMSVEAMRELARKAALSGAKVPGAAGAVILGTGLWEALKGVDKPPLKWEPERTFAGVPQPIGGTTGEILEQMAVMAGFEYALPPVWGATKAVAKAFAKPVKGVGREVSKGVGRTMKELVDLPLARPLAKMLPKTFHGETLRELFQPVIERAEPMLKGALRQKELYGDLGRQAVTETAARVKALTLEERYHVADLIKATRFTPARGRNTAAFMHLPLDSKRRVTEALSPLLEWQTYIGKTSPTHDTLRQLNLLKQVQERFLKTMGEEGGVLEPTYLEELMPFLRGEAGPESAMNSFKEVMAHPAMSDEAKLLAKDLFKLNYHIADTLPTAIQHAEKSVLFSKLHNNPKWVSPTPRPGMVRSAHPSFKGLWVEKDVDQAIKEYEYVPTFFSRGVNKYFMTPWKMAKVVGRVPAHFRNMISNHLLNWLGGMPLTGMGYYRQAARELRTQSAGVKNFARLSGFGTTFAEVEIAPLLREMEMASDFWQASDNMLTRIAGSASKRGVDVAKVFNKAYQMEEVIAKYAKYLHNLEKRMSKKEAVADAVRWTFNYAQVTPFTKSIRQTFVPFATWTTKVIPLLAEAAHKNPIKVAALTLLPTALTTASIKATKIQPEEWEQIRRDLPDYLRTGLVGLVPWRDQKGRLQLVNYTWFVPGVGDVVQMYAGISSVGAIAQTLTQNPLLSIAGDVAHNKTRLGVPIYYDWEPTDTKLWKLLTYGWMQLAPGVASTDLRKLAQTMEGGPQALTPTQFFFNQFGVPIVPVNPQELRRRRVLSQGRAMREIGGRLRSEMMRAQTPAERKAVEEKYQKLFQAFQKREQ